VHCYPHHESFSLPRPPGREVPPPVTNLLQARKWGSRILLLPPHALPRPVMVVGGTSPLPLPRCGCGRGVAAYCYSYHVGSSRCGHGEIARDQIRRLEVPQVRGADGSKPESNRTKERFLRGKFSNRPFFVPRECADLPWRIDKENKTNRSRGAAGACGTPPR